MGVHPLLFSNVQEADTATPLFKTELSRYAVQGRWRRTGRSLVGRGTISARMGLARSNMTAVSPAHPEFRKFLMDQYMQMIRDGAEGFQLDKTNLVGLLDFNPTLRSRRTSHSSTECSTRFRSCFRKAGRSILLFPWLLRFGSTACCRMSTSPICAWATSICPLRRCLHLPNGRLQSSAKSGDFNP